MAAAEDSIDDDVGTSLRELRPKPATAPSLEKRLAIAAILAGASTEPVRTTLGRLTIQRRLGGGGMGVVYRAFDPDLGRLVAVKLLRGSVEREARSLVAAEARALAKVSHPNVVTVHEIVDRDDELYFVMEHVAGVTLRRWLDGHPHARWPEVLEWFVQAGRGLAAAHAGGLVHRDFKPENVLVGDDGRARVLDFGLAAFGEREGVAGGTPHFMAPELRAGERASEASDQFAFCRALADALEGRDAPSELRALVERGLADEPTERHAALPDLIDALDRTRLDASLRSRALLLERVERLWLRGVLERSLGADGGVDLRLACAPELVAPPWEEWGAGEALPSHASARELAEVLRQTHDTLLIVGPPGAGKTTTLLWLCRDLHRTSAVDRATPVPVVLGLSNYRPDQPLVGFVVDELVAKYGLPRPRVSKWLERGEIALLFDGLDEAPTQVRRDIVEAINALRSAHPVPTVVACRDEEYEALGTRLRFGGAYRVEPLDDDAVHELLGTRAALALDERVSVDDALRDKLRNPLLLTLCARSHGEGDASWGTAYERYVTRAFETSDEGERARLEPALRYLARAMRRAGTSELWIERLTFGWLDRSADRVLGYASGVALVMLVILGVHLSTLLVDSPLGSALTLGVGVTVASFAFTRGRLRPIERLRWSWRRALRLLPLTLLCGSVLGFLEGLRGNMASRLLGAAMTAVVLAVAFALEASEEPTRVRPNEGIRRSLTYALGVSLGFAVPAGLFFGLVVEPCLLMPLRDFEEHAGDPRWVGGSAVASVVVTVLFLLYGGFTVLMHGVLRLWLAARTPLPFRLQRMLDRAVELDLMRQVGGGYVFLHRTLADHWADE